MDSSVRSAAIVSSARRALVDVRRRCVHVPVVTVAVIAAVLAVASTYGVFGHELPLDVAFRYAFSGRVLTMGHWSTLLTSQVLTRDIFMAISIALSLALMLGVYEAVAGSVRAVVVTAVSAVAGPLLVAGGLGIGSALGNDFAGRTLSTLDYGASAITAGAGGALVAVLGMRRLRWFAYFWVGFGLLVHHQLADWEHLGSFATGYGLGHVLGTPPVGRVRRAFAGITARPVNLGWIAIPSLILATVAGGLLGNAIVPPRTNPTVTRNFIPAGVRHLTAVRMRAVLSGASPAEVRAVTFPTPSLGGNHPALIVLPPGYGATQTRYPVIEILHGRPGSPNDIITGLDPVGLEALPGLPPFIAVVPDGHGPTVFNGEFADTSKQHLGTALSDDLRRWVDRHYRTTGVWSVAGLSSGGYGAAYLGSRTAGQYDSVCALSGNFTPQGGAFHGESRASLDAATPLLHVRPDGPRTLLIAGSHDRGSVREAQTYAWALGRVGQPHELAIVPGGHNWKMWQREFPRCLRFMLSGPRPTPSRATTTALPISTGLSRPWHRRYVAP